MVRDLLCLVVEQDGKGSAVEPSRLRILENRHAPPEIGGVTVADILPARRRRRCEVTGLPY
jgi:hypothetical protein